MLRSVPAGTRQNHDGAAAVPGLEAGAELGRADARLWHRPSPASTRDDARPHPCLAPARSSAGLAVEDLDLVELNEAFAAQAIPVIRELGLDPEKTNVNGGAIAIGHPLGASGARLTATLLHEMRRRGARYGVATMCIGVGQGIAAVFESVE